MYQSANTSCSAILKVSPTPSPQGYMDSLSPDCTDMEKLRAILAMTLTDLWGLISWEGPNGPHCQPSWFKELSEQLDPYLVMMISAVTTPESE